MLHLIDRFFVLSHVIAGMLALVVAPLAMATVKGGLWHRRWGKLYFYGMAWIFVSTIGLAFFRFNAFLFIVNILSFYGAVVGYRVLYRKRPGQPGQTPKAIDWVAATVMLVAGMAFVAWGLAGLMGAHSPELLLGSGMTPFYVIGTLAGLLITRTAVVDLRAFRNYASAIPSDRSWWQIEHATRFANAYIATVTAFLVQNVARRIPGELQWIVWVLPGIVGGMLIARWVRGRRSNAALQAARA
jgi:uncharacterized membrane protein